MGAKARIRPAGYWAVYGAKLKGPRWLRSLLLYLVLLVLSFIFIFPFFWTVSSSLKTTYEIFLFPPTWLPARPAWGNYVEVLSTVPFARWIRNTVVVVMLSTFGTIISATLVAYSFARFEYRGRDILFLLTLGTMMLPAEVTLIPRFVLFHKMRWIDTIKPLWVPTWFGGGAFFIFLIRQFLMSLPRELDEAALVDGANPFRVFWSILLPLCKPVLATVTVISFIDHWNDFMGPLIYLNTPDKFTVALGIQFFKDVPMMTQRPTHHLLMAAVVMTAMPCITLFFLAQRYFVRGIVLSGIKG